MSAKEYDLKKQLKLYNNDYFVAQTNTITVERRDNQEPFPLHCHEFDEVVIVLGGNGLHSWNNEIHPITIGDVLYISHEDIHGYQSVNNLKLNNILYQRHNLWARTLIELYLPSPNSPQNERFWRIHPSYLQQVEPIINAIANEANKNSPHAIHLVESLFLQLLIMLHRLRQRPTNNFHSKLHQLDTLFTVLHQSINSEFNITKFCQQYGISSRSLHRLFKNQTNMTISEYLQKLRLCRAMSLLRNSQLAINTIAAECGYNDSNYFSLVFKKETTKTPSQYREQFKNGIAFN